jgi:1-aminocyclopropane-1-carboxylate deaminase
MLRYHATPVQRIYHDAAERSGIRLLIKREDLNHPFVSGNKWWKLKYNLTEARRKKFNTVLTFGGAFSNHIYATAGAAKAEGFESIGVIRGDDLRPRNATLQFAEEQGMKLHFVSREAYRRKSEADFVGQLHEQFGEFYAIPEGGTNAEAIKGSAELGKLLLDVPFDYLCLPVGTGGTMAGILTAMPSTKTILGFAILKGGDFLRDDIDRLTAPADIHASWDINADYHFGGYGKYTAALLDFMRGTETEHAIPLDQVYTAKMLYGVFDLLEKGHFKPGSTVLLLHTGGIQGRITEAS